MTTANRPVIDPITASVIQGALENIAVEMGYKLMRMSYSSIIRESEDFGAGLVDADGNGLAESAQSTPLQSGPIPGYIRGIRKIMAARGEEIRPGDVIMHNDAYSGRATGPTSRSSCRSSSRRSWSPSRPPRPITSTSARCRPDPAASSTPWTPMPRACSSRRSRSTTRAGATTWSGTSCATTSAPPTSWSVTWRRRSPRAGSARSAWASSSPAMGCPPSRPVAPRSWTMPSG